MTTKHVICQPGRIPADVPQPASSSGSGSYSDVYDFKFVLDEFQQRAMAAITAGESVLIAAHTSSGKTTPAIYAIALALKNRQRVIYTTPIKALSNQKFQELRLSFPDESVGLVTGDVALNKDANLLVMTTEILRSMLYHRAGEVAEVAWVVFDEIHYLRDAERGVVWEESIILLPKHIRCVFLSATIPNYIEFGQWIAEQHDGPCHVISTTHRPTPLRHFMFPAGGPGLFLVLNEAGEWKQSNFEAMAASFNQDTKPKKGTSGLSDIAKVVSLVLDLQLDPVIVFSFSRRECEALALQLNKATAGALISEEQQANASVVLEAALASLSSDDVTLPQVRYLRPLLLSGIGVHHSGMLPFLREITEMLFQEGMIRVLFATETFAMGLNMPARTCIFSSCHKFDGTDTRMITSGEYVQMSGRAGRRGLDDRGTVIVMVDSRLDPEETKEMVSGRAEELASSFHLGYNMILNALRTADVDAESIIRRSFMQFQAGYRASADDDAILHLRQLLDAIAVPTNPQIMEFVRLEAEEQEVKEQLRRACYVVSALLPMLCPGRIIRVVDDSEDWGWGVVLAINKRGKTRTNETGVAPGDDEKYVVDVLVAALDPSFNASSSTDAPPLNPTPHPAMLREGVRGGIVAPVTFGAIGMVSALVLDMANHRDVRGRTESTQCLAAMRRLLLMRREVPELDPERDLGEISAEARAIALRLRSLRRGLRTHPLPLQLARCREKGRKGREKRKREEGEDDGSDMDDDDDEGNAADEADALETAINDCHRRLALEKQLAPLGAGAREQGLEAFRLELNRRKRVLLCLGYVDAAEMMTAKGKMACEVEVADDLVPTELMFQGALGGLGDADVAALISCLVAEEKKHPESKKCATLLREQMKILREAKRTVRREEVGCGLRSDDSEEELNTTLMDVTHAWVEGAKFSDVCKMTDMFEGSIVRSFRRLAELLMQMSRGAHAIGDEVLEAIFASAVTKMQRGVVCASSLYA